MSAGTGDPKPLLKRRATRRAVVGGTVAAASVAVAYAALGDRLGLAGSASSGSAADIRKADADAIDQESVKVSHLLRRAGFGVTKEEHDRYQSMGLNATLDELLSYTKVNDDEAVGLAGQVSLDPANRGGPTAWWLIRMANTKRPLQEKMTLFWHNLLTSQISVVRDPTAMVAQNEFFRAHAFDAFPAILRGVSMDAAMMVYLDVAGSVRGAPNENYARELMELFSLGVGNFTEDDVREASRAFTGWQVPRNRIDQNVFTLQAPVFRPQRFDNGSKTFMGRTGNFRPDDIVQIISEQPAIGTYITGRLFSYFVHPEPAEDDLAPFVEVYNRNGGSVGAVVEAMLRSDVFYSPRAYRALVKSPLEYAIGALKALGLQARIGEALAAGGGPRRGGGVLGEMGQIPFEPPNVAGWPGGAAWLNSATIFARLNFLNLVTGGQLPGRPNRPAAQQQPGARPNAPRAAQQQPRGAQSQPAPDLDLGTAAEALGYFLPLVLDDNLPGDARKVLLDYAGGADARLAPDQLRGLVYLVLGAPQFHLA